MQDGDIAGLAIFQKPYGFIGVKKERNKKSLIMVNNGKLIKSVEIDVDELYLRGNALFGSGAAPLYGGKSVENSGTGTFSYSVDGKSYTSLGNTLNMEFNLDVFTGNKFCLFNFATKQIGGFVDFDFFRSEPIMVK